MYTCSAHDTIHPNYSTIQLTGFSRFCQNAHLCIMLETENYFSIFKNIEKHL